MRRLIDAVAELNAQGAVAEGGDAMYQLSGEAKVSQG